MAIQTRKMTTTATKAVVHKAMTDESFLNQLHTSPEKALNEFNLSEDERAAIQSGKESQIREYLGEAKALFVAIVVWTSGD